VDKRIIIIPLDDEISNQKSKNPFKYPHN
jgi:hypothetical protein